MFNLLKQLWEFFTYEAPPPLTKEQQKKFDDWYAKHTSECDIHELYGQCDCHMKGTRP